MKAIYHLCCFYYLTPLCLHLYSLTQKQNPHSTRLVQGDNLLSSVTSSAPMSAGLSGTRAKNSVCCSNINPFDIHLLVWRQKIKLYYFTSLFVLNFHVTCWGLFKMIGVNTVLYNISKYVVQVKWSTGFRLSRTETWDPKLPTYLPTYFWAMVVLHCIWTVYRLLSGIYTDDMQWLVPRTTHIIVLSPLCTLISLQLLFRRVLRSHGNMAPQGSLSDWESWKHKAPSVV